MGGNKRKILILHLSFEFCRAILILDQAWSPPVAKPSHNDLNRSIQLSILRELKGLKFSSYLLFFLISNF